MREAEHKSECPSSIDDARTALAGLIAGVPLALQLCGADGRTVACNDAYVRMFGARPAADHNILHDELAAAHGLPELLRRGLGGESVHVAARWHLPAASPATDARGRPRDVDVTVVPLPDGAGGIGHVALCFRDRSGEHDLTRALDALGASEARVRQALLAGRMVAWDVDLDAGTIVLSVSAAEVLGLPGERAMGITDVLALLDLADRARLADAVAAATRTGVAPELQLQVRRPDDGAMLWLEARGELIRTGDGRIRGARGLVLDITERRHQEAMRARSRELEDENRRVVEASRIKSEFLASMSHELRTPLNGVLGFAQVLHDGMVPPSSPQHREFLGDILTSGRHLLRLINDILDLARVEAGKMLFYPEPCDLTAVLIESSTAVRADAVARQVTVELDVDAELGPVTVDPTRIKQIVQNYLANALKFTAAGGRVVVRATAVDARRFRIEVEDTGIGIAADDLARLFVSFEQLQSGAGKPHPGSGLGLALVRRLTEAMGGEVGVRSVPGVGSTFFVLLPRHAPAGRQQRHSRAVFGVPRADREEPA